MGLKEEYHEFLKSEEWKHIRAARMAIDGNVCAICGATDKLRVHHISYENGWCDVDNMITVCDRCHEDAHRYEKAVKAAEETEEYKVLQEQVREFYAHIVDGFVKETARELNSNGRAYMLSRNPKGNHRMAQYIDLLMGKDFMYARFYVRPRVERYQKLWKGRK